MKISAIQVCSLIVVLGITIVSVCSTPIFDLRPSCIYNGHATRQGRNINTGTCEVCFCSLGHPLCHSRRCPFPCRGLRCPAIPSTRRPTAEVI